MQIVPTTIVIDSSTTQSHTRWSKWHVVIVFVIQISHLDINSNMILKVFIV